MLPPCRFDYSGPCLVALLVALGASNASAAPPKLDAIFPCGAQRGTTVWVTVAGKFGHWPVQAWVDRPGLEVAVGTEKNQLTVKVAPDAAPGTYWIRLYDDEGASSPHVFIVGTLPELNEIEPNDDRRKPQTITAPSVVVNGRLNKAGDVDTFAVSLSKGQTIVASIEANRTLGAPMDSVLQLLSADGFVLSENDDYHDLDSQITWVVPQDGTYVVRTFGFPAVPTSTIGFAGADDFVYRLTITTGAFVEYAYPLALSATSAEVDGHESAEIAGMSAVELHGWNIPDAASRSTVRAGAPGRPVTIFHEEVAGTAIVRCEPHATIVEQEPNGRDSPQEIQLPVTITGRIDSRIDVDVYRFRAKKGDKLIMRAESRALGFPLDPLLRLTDTTGKVLAEVDDSAGGRDAELAYTVADDGEYRLLIRDLNAQGGDRYVYRLSVLYSEPDFSLKVAADSFVITPDKSFEIPVTVERLNGLADEIEIVAEGFPSEISVTLARSLNSGDSAKSAKLLIKTSTGSLSGPFRIVGRSPATGSTPRVAMAPIPNITATTGDLWFTVLAAKSAAP